MSEAKFCRQAAPRRNATPPGSSVVRTVVSGGAP